MKSLATKAFTLVEVVIAVGILLMVVGAAAVVIKQNIQATSANKHKTQAVGLAQEGANLVRSIRDTNLLTPGGTAFDGLTTSADPYCLYKDPASNNWELKAYTDPLCNQEGNGYFTLNGKKFTREIILE